MKHPRKGCDRETDGRSPFKFDCPNVNLIGREETKASAIQQTKRQTDNVRKPAVDPSRLMYLHQQPAFPHHKTTRNGNNINPQTIVGPSCFSS
ncbi:unnamed protein product [Camellia sinensis]